MSLKPYIFALLLLSQTALLMGQSGSQPLRNSEIGILPLKWESNTETFYFSGALKKVAGIYYNRSLTDNGMLWTSSLSYASSQIPDFCDRCDDAASGVGQLREAILSSGIGYEAFVRRRFPIKPYVQMEAHYGYSNYSGEFFGGWGGFFQHDRHFHVLGTTTKAGLKATILNRVTISALAGLRWGMGFSTSQTPNRRSGSYLGHAISLCELRVGMKF